MSVVQRVPPTRRYASILAAGLYLLTAGVLPAGASPRASPSDPPPLEVVQDHLDPDDRLPAPRTAAIARVLQANRAFLGAPVSDFCTGLSAPERPMCLEEVRTAPQTRIDGPVRLEEDVALRRGGREWPNAESVAKFRRIRLTVRLGRGRYTATHEINLVRFESRSAADVEECLFPLEHWSWAEMDRPERFARAPTGECAGRTLTVAGYLLEQVPHAAPFALRFLSEAEARAWTTGDPEKIKWESPYTSGHPYAKYFLLGSQRWWRGGGGAAAPPRPGYRWAVRIEHLPLARIYAWEERGDAFLDIFEDGAQIEFTNLTKAGLEALLAEDPVVLVDVSEHGDAAARFVPWRESNGR